MADFIGKFFISVDNIPHTFPGFVQLCFMGGVYGYVLCYASNMIKDGSELLLLVPALAGVVGSIVLPVLGAVPDGAIVIFSGLGDNAQEEVSVGVGALAGSTIMLLTVPWMLSVIAGRVAMVNGEPQYVKPKGWAKGQPWAKITDDTTFLQTGVKCGPSIRKSAFLMLITLIPYLIIQIPAAFNKCVMEADVNKCQTPQWASIFGAVLATFFFLFYLWFQAQQADEDPVKADLIDEVRKDALRKHLVTVRGLVFDKMKEHDSEGNMPLDPKNERFRKCIRSFFLEFDVDNSGYIDSHEFYNVLRRMGENPSTEQLDDLMRAVDTDGDGHISFDEFCVAIVKMSEESFLDQTIRDHKVESAKISALKRNSGENLPLINSSVQPIAESEEKKEDGDDVESEDEAEEDVEMPDDLAHLSPAEQQKRIIKRSFFLMGVGVLIVLIFSDPMVDVLTALGDHSGIKPFYIAFVLAPLASNASEVIAAYAYALRKTEKTITISFSSLIGAACMNNTFCLALFLYLIYIRNLQWTFSAETIAIVAIELAMFLVAIRRIHPAWTGIAVAVLFPLSIGLVAGLEAIGFD